MRRTVRRAMPVLALLIGLQGSPPSIDLSGPRLPVGTVRVVPTALSLEVEGRGLRVRISRQPWQIAILTDAGRTLVQGDPVAGPLTFVLDARALAAVLPSGRSPMHGGGRLAVHLRRLLPGWSHQRDGMILRAATDDPLGRTAIIEVHLAAPGVVQVTARLADDRAVVAAQVSMRSGSDEHFFGLGEQFGNADARGRRAGMLVQDGMPFDHPLGAYAPVPFFVSSRGYGFYLAATRPSVFSLDAGTPSAWRVTVQAPALTWDLLAGPQPAAVIARYADLTGHPPLPPPWTLGVWKCLIGGQTRVLAEARRLRALHIPVSVIWSYDAVDERLDLGWPYPNFVPIPPGPYPNLPDFTATLHRLGYKVLGYVSPEFTPSRPSFAYPARAGYFVRGSGGHIYLLDLTNPAARRWWQGDLRQILVHLGFDGWLQDLGDRLPQGARFADGRDATEMANLYPLLYARAADEVARATKPDALLVMRTGYAGSQRYQRAVWAGDQYMVWDRDRGLPAVIPAGLSWGIAQAPFWGPDIGGYLDGHLPRANQEELYLRWLEFGAFSPIMRDTLGMKGRDAIYMGSDARTLSAFRFYAQLHQQLFPYLYSAARTAHLTGLPIMRHLFLAYPTDRHVYGLNDEYLLGPDLLVAPVTEAGARTRTVYLPSGSWVDYWSGALLAGGRRVRVAAPVERIPLFVRAGALLPLLADPGDTLAPAAAPAVHRSGNALLIHIYPGGSSDSTVLADGTTLGYTAGAWGVTLRITSATARRYQVEMPFGQAPVAVRLDGHALPRQAAGARAGEPGWRYAAAGARVSITVQVASGQLHVVGAGFRGSGEKG